MSPGRREGSSKRRVTEISEDDALEAVRSHAKDLADALQTLNTSTSHDAAIQKLKGLSTTVLPALERLSKRRTSQDPSAQVATQVCSILVLPSMEADTG